MGKLSRDKGKRAEVELCHLLQGRGITAKRTAAMQAGDDQWFADVTGLHHSGLRLLLECKNTKALPPKGVMDAIEQVDCAEPGAMHVARAVAMRVTGKPGQFIFAMRESTLLDLLSRIPSQKEQA